MKPKPIIFALLVCCILGECDAFGQAYCALRDPTKRIYEFYPDATSFKSLVRTVDEGVRQSVSTELPFTIHFNELGRHTLYVPVKQARPLGLVHARSEPGNFGLSEIVWSLTPSLEVKDFAFQRCRSRKRTTIESDEFKRQIIGKDFQQLRMLLTENGNSVAQGQLDVSEEAREMAAIVVRSALKTIAVSRSAWARDLQIIQPLYRVDRAYPNASQVRKIDQPYDQQVTRGFDRQFASSSGENSTNIDRQNVLLLEANDGQGQLLGHVAKTPWKSMDYELTLWWKIRRDQVIEGVVADGGWPDAETKNAFENVVGLAADRIHECNSAAEIAGAEVLMLCRRN